MSFGLPNCIKVENDHCIILQGQEPGVVCGVVQTLPGSCPFLRLVGQGRLKRWTSQLDLGNTIGGIETVVSVHNFGAP